MRPSIPVSQNGARVRKRKARKPRLASAVTKAKSTRNLDANAKTFLGILCPICLEQIESGCVSSTMCGHIFCTGCIKRALRHSKYCPTCRRLMRGQGCHRLYLNDTIKVGPEEF